jgi:hypothetical protein
MTLGGPVGLGVSAGWIETSIQEQVPLDDFRLEH